MPRLPSSAMIDTGRGFSPFSCICLATFRISSDLFTFVFFVSAIVVCTSGWRSYRWQPSVRHGVVTNDSTRFGNVILRVTQNNATLSPEGPITAFTSRHVRRERADSASRGCSRSPLPRDVAGVTTPATAEDASPPADRDRIGGQDILSRGSHGQQKTDRRGKKRKSTPSRTRT